MRENLVIWLSIISLILQLLSLIQTQNNSRDSSTVVNYFIFNN